MTRILIAGAGIGGLSLVRALRGWDHVVDIAERSPVFHPAGVGIVLHPNGMAVLDRLGLTEQVRAHANVIERLDVVRGESVLRVSLAEVWQGMGYPTTSILRTDLHNVLHNGAFMPGQPGVNLQMGRRLVRVDSEPHQPIAYFDDGRQARYDLIVGADGVHSPVRTSLFPEAQSLSTGLLYFRFAADNVIDLPASTWRAVELAEASYGFIPLRGNRVHCFVQLPAASNPCEAGREASFFEENFSPWDPQLARTLAARCSPIHAGFAYMVKPARWSKGTCVLLGDAAHAVSPTLSEGGSLAMEDALILALALRQSKSIGEAIATYELARRDRVAFSQRMALAQVNSARKRRSNGNLESGAATLHMRQMYAPLRRALIPPFLSPALSVPQRGFKLPQGEYSQVKSTHEEGVTANG